MIRVRIDVQASDGLLVFALLVEESFSQRKLNIQFACIISLSHTFCGWSSAGLTSMYMAIGIPKAGLEL